ncbi:MAG TPA: hypothetical protein PLA97_19160, partial [Rubrivivax sp.]|nr:hypothetical protein [Rubrivivax sp.]
EAWFAQAGAVPDRGEPLRRNVQPFCDLARAEAAVLQGQAEKALGLLDRWVSAGVPPSIRLSGQLVLAEVQLALKRTDDALATATHAVATARGLQADNRHSARTGQALMLQALAEQQRGDANAALRHQVEAAAHLHATVHASQRWRLMSAAAAR